MAKQELVKELENGRASFSLWGTVKVDSETFGEEQKSKSGYIYKRANFPVQTGEGRSTYVGLMGGFFPDNKVLKRYNKNSNEMFEIAWEDRKNEQIIEQVSPSALITVRVEHEDPEDDSSKLITKQFISEMDAIDYLRDKLHNGEDVYIGGQVDYSYYNDKVQRQLNIHTIALNEPYIKDGEQQPAHTHDAILRQTYLLDDSSVSKRFKSELEKNHETVISAWVPQYVSKIDGREIKAVRPLPQTFVIQADGSDEDLERQTKLVEKFIKVPSRDFVRQMGVEATIADGFETVQGEVELTDELKELIDLGIMKKEDIEQQMTVTGSSVRKLIFRLPLLDKETKQVFLDKYDPSVLVVPDIDDDDTKDDPFGDGETETVVEEADVSSDDKDGLNGALDDLFKDA